MGTGCRWGRFGELIKSIVLPTIGLKGVRPPADASSGLTELRFATTETTETYMIAMSRNLERYSRPADFCSDRHSIFRIH